MPKFKKLGSIFVISAPSGSGKTTIASKLVQRIPNLSYSVSVTTRKPRQGEINSKHYYFVTEDEFKRKIKNNELIEWTKVYGDYYGTPKKFLLDSINKNRDVIMDLDIKGALNIKKMFPQNSTTIFLMPPSLKELKARLRKREKNNFSNIKKRILEVKKEIPFSKKYDYIVVNDTLSTAIKKIEKIIYDRR